MNSDKANPGVLIWIHNRHDPRVVEAMTKRCGVCGSAAGKKCFSPINGGGELEGRAVHLARVETWRLP